MTSQHIETMEHAERWRRLVQQAESPQALDWVKRNCERKGYMTPEMTKLVALREREIEEGRHGQPF